MMSPRTDVEADGNFLIPNGTFFAELLIFLIVLGVIWFFVVPPIRKVLAEREDRVSQTTANNKEAKDVFAEVWKSGAEPAAVVKSKGLAQVSDERAIAAAVDAVLAESPKAIADYKAGNPRALGALIGPVMKRMGGKGNPAIIKRVLAERISSEG